MAKSGKKRGHVRRIPKARSIKRRRGRSAVDVTRGEYNHIIDILNERNIILNGLREAVERLERSDAVQLHRTAEIQRQLDELRKLWTTLKFDLDK